MGSDDLVNDTSILSKTKTMWRGGPRLGIGGICYSIHLLDLFREIC